MIPSPTWFFVGPCPNTNIPILQPPVLNTIVVQQAQENTSGNNPSETTNYVNGHVIIPNETELEVIQLRAENERLNNVLHKVDTMSHNICVTLFSESQMLRARCEQLNHEKKLACIKRKHMNNTINVLRARLDYAEEKFLKTNSDLSSIQQKFEITNEYYDSELLETTQESEKIDETSVNTNDKECNMESTVVHEQAVVEEKACNKNRQQDSESKLTQDISSISKLNHVTKLSHPSSSRNLHDFIKNDAEPMKSEKTSRDEEKTQHRLLSNNLNRSYKTIREKMNEITILTDKFNKAESQIRHLESEINYLNTKVMESGTNAKSARQSYENNLKYMEEKLKEALKQKICTTLPPKEDSKYTLYLKERTQRIESELIDARKKVIVLQKDVGIKQESLLQMTQRNDLLRSEVKKLRNEKQQLEECNIKDLENFENQIKLIQIEVTEQHKNVKLLETALDQRSEKLKAVQLDNVLLNENISSFGEKMQNTQKEINILKSQNNELESEIERLKSELNQVKEKNYISLECLKRDQCVKKYSRDFLISLKDDPLSIEYPTDLPNMECIQKKVVEHHMIQIDWYPRYYTCDYQKHHENYNKPINTVEEQRTTYKNSLKDEDIFKQSRGILNKLTPEKYEKLILKFKDLHIDTPTRMRGVAQIIVEKASNEPHFAEMYSLFCCDLTGGYHTAAQTPAQGEDTTLQHEILELCGQEFARMRGETVDMKRCDLEKQISESPDNIDLKEQLKEYDTKIKRRNVGFCTFLGELYNRKFLDAKALFNCIDCLMISCDEESIECLCKIMIKVGLALETHDANKEMMNKLFSDIRTNLNKLNMTNSRLRFMLMDLHELRILNWKPKTKNDNKPVTLAEISEKVDSENIYSTDTRTLRVPSWSHSSPRKNSMDSNYKSIPQPKQETEERKSLCLDKVSESPAPMISYSKAVTSSQPKPVIVTGVSNVILLMPEYLK